MGADTRALLVVAALAAVSLVAEISSRLADVARLHLAISAAEIWLLELTSHIAIVALAALLPRLLDRAPLASQSWRTNSAILAAGYLAFAGLHVTVMYASRLALFPLIVGGPYPLEMFRIDVLRYEFAKDLLVYPALLVVFWLSRRIDAARLDAEAALQRTRSDHLLRLKTGGGIVVLNAADVLWAKAAGNYVEVHTAAAMHFCRITLAQLDAMLDAAGANHARVHKSYLVNLKAIKAITPTGEGDATITLAGGATAPASRRYRHRLPQA